MLAAAAVVGVASAPVAGQFTFVETLEVTFDIPMFPTCVDAGDLNEDGELDLVISGRNVEGVIQVMFGLPGGGFAPPAELLIESQTDWVLVRDFDGDEHLDVALSLRANLGGVAVLLGAGDGTFPTRLDTPAGRQPGGMVAADFDGDGDDDLAVTNYLSDTVSVLANDGAGDFAVAQRIRLGYVLQSWVRPIYVAAADLDGDEDLDLVASHLQSGKTSLMMNTGGVFGSAINIPIGTPVTVAPSDADLDGDADLLYTDMAGFIGKVIVLANAGDASFTEATQFFSASWSWHLATADLDGDGREDLAVTNPSSGRIHFHRNESDGAIAFGPDQFLTLGAFPRFTLPVDLDEDLDLDLVVVDITAHRLYVLRNDTPQGAVATVAKHDQFLYAPPVGREDAP